MSFVITYAGQLESQMATCRILVKTTKYETLGAAKRDIAMMIPGDTEEILAGMVAVKGDGWYVYADQNAGDSPEAWPASTLFAISIDHEGNTIDVESGTLEGLAEELASVGYDGPWVRVRSPKDATTAGWVRNGDWKA